MNDELTPFRTLTDAIDLYRHRVARINADLAALAQERLRLLDEARTLGWPLRPVAASLPIPNAADAVAQPVEMPAAGITFRPTSEPQPQSAAVSPAVDAPQDAADTPPGGDPGAPVSAATEDTQGLTENSGPLKREAARAKVAAARPAAEMAEG